MLGHQHPPPKLPSKPNGPPRALLMVQITILCAAALAIASSPTLAAASLRRAEAAWYVPGGVLLVAMGMLGTELCIEAAHVLFTFALGALVAWGSARIVCDPMVRAVWYHHSVVGTPRSADASCNADWGGRYAVGMAAGVWWLAMIVVLTTVRRGLIACAVLSCLVTVVMNDDAWDWRPAVTLITACILTGYLGVGMERASARTSAGAWAQVWLFLPNVLYQWLLMLLL